MFVAKTYLQVFFAIQFQFQFLTFISWNIPWWDYFICPTLWAQSKQTRIQHIMIFCHIKYDGIQFRYVAQVRIQLSSRSEIGKLFCLKKVCLELQFEESTISNCWPRLLFQNHTQAENYIFLLISFHSWRKIFIYLSGSGSLFIIWAKRKLCIKQYLAITQSIGFWRRCSWRFLNKISCFSEEERLSFLTTSRHVFRFSKFSSRHWSLALSCCSSVVWSPAATHWCWWSWRGTSQQGQSGRWDDEQFVVSLDFQIPSDFVSFNFGGGWLTGWDARHTQGMTWQTHGLSCCSALVWGFSSVGRATEDWRSSTRHLIWHFQ